jgi:GNAT superfamily N-acetyltransferase
MAYEISFADPKADIVEVCRTFRQFAPSIESYYPRASLWFLETVLPGFVTDSRHVWLAREGSESIGIAISKAIDSNHERAKICTLFVGVFARRRGVGTALLSRLVEWHDRENFSRLYIRCPSPVRHALQPLLRSHNFICDGDYRLLSDGRGFEHTFERLSSGSRDGSATGGFPRFDF